jgi:carboxymethylenebutenolidase
VDIRSEERVIDGRTVLVARPTADGSWPGVVMLHEVFGLDDVLRRHAARLASAGYVVYAPDLLGDGFRLACMIRVFRSLQNQRGSAFEVIEAVRVRVAADAECSGRVGVIGFCMGGGFALLVAARGFDAASINYGPIPGNVDDILRGACPTVASYGERDRLFDAVPRLEAALIANDIPHDLKTYPTGGHSFLNDEPNGPRVFRHLAKIAHVGPDPTAAADAWPRIEAFFAEQLGERRADD